MKTDQQKKTKGAEVNQQMLEALNSVVQSLGAINERLTHTEQVVAQVQQRPVIAPTEAPALASQNPQRRGPGRPRKYPLATPAPVEPEVPKPVPLTLEDKIRLALTQESLSTSKLAKTIGRPATAVTEEIQRLRSEGKIYNVGFEDSAIWTWRIGDATDAPTLQAVVKRLMSERPMRVEDLVRATGARPSRVSGAVIEVQRTNRVEDLSGGGHAKLYFVVGEHWRDASLQPKMHKGRPIKHGERREVAAKK